MSEWKEEFKAYVESLNLPRDDYKGIIEYIEDAPTVDAEPVRHGEWLEREDDYDWYVFCSECGDEYVEDKGLGLASYVKQYFNYCPCCGAKMDRGE